VFQDDKSLANLQSNLCVFRCLDSSLYFHIPGSGEFVIAAILYSKTSPAWSVMDVQNDPRWQSRSARSLADLYSAEQFFLSTWNIQALSPQEPKPESTSFPAHPLRFLSFGKINDSCSLRGLSLESFGVAPSVQLEV
jgi:hypothetical protein